MPTRISAQFKVPAGDAAYKLTTSVRRSAALTSTSTRIDATWTFHSKKPSGLLAVQLPASSVRFNGTTGLDSTVAAGKKATFPVTVQGPAKGHNLKSLTVYVSYDGSVERIHCGPLGGTSGGANSPPNQAI